MTSLRSRGKVERVSGKRRRIVLAFVLTAFVAGVVVLVAARGPSQPHAAGDAPRWPLLPVAASPESTPETPETPEAIDKRAEDALGAWRNAILIRDADMVIKLELAFLETPSMYLERLKTSARSDDNERVRAFSTRELGKFKRVDLAPTFQQLLEDKSGYVRQNAAWALGELSAGTDGRAAVRIAKGELRQLVKRDPEEAVGVAARTALERIE